MTKMHTSAQFWLRALILFALGATLLACSGPGETEVSPPEPSKVAVNTTLAARRTAAAGKATPASGQATAPAPAETQAAPEDTAAAPVVDSDEPTPPPPPKVKPLKMNSPAYSVQAFLWYRPEIADRDLNAIRDMGFGWVKQEFAWRDIEGAKKGAFDWSRADAVVYAANAKKIDLLARIDNSPDWAAPGCFNPAKSSMGPPTRTSDWTDFLKAFASRYKQRVRAYEIWNEPNLAREWCNRPPSAAAYAKFLQASYQAIKSVDPNAMIISGGLTPTTCCADGGEAIPDAQFFRQLYQAMGGSSDGYFDVLGVHAAGYKAPPEADPASVANDPALTNHDPSSPELKRIYCFRHVEDIRKIMEENGDGDKQIAITEFGWTSDPVNPAYAWFRVDEQEKADRIVRAYKYAKANWSPWIGVMSLIYIANADWTKDDEKYWWAITDPDGTPRPAYIALKNMPK